MLPGIYSAATGMQRAKERHEVIAHNLAHLNVPGFRRATVPLQNFESSFDAARQRQVAFNSLGSHNAGVQHDFTSGPLQLTGRKLDVAIQGDGFFTIEGPSGDLYTRNGAFQLNSERQLVTNDGLPVAGDLRLPADAPLNSLLIQSDGTVEAGGTQIGRLQIVRFEDVSQLQQAGATLFRAPNGINAVASDATVAQEYLEGANVNPVTELVAMITAQREHDAAQRAITNIERAIENHTDLQG